MKTKKDSQEALRLYVKTLTPEQRVDYALRSGTNDAYLSQLINGHAKPSAEMARNLAEQSGWVIHPSEIHSVFDGIPAKA